MGAFLGLLAKGLKGYGKSVGRGIRSDLEQGVQGVLDPLQRRKKPGDLPQAGVPATAAAAQPTEMAPWDEDYGFAAPGAGIPLPQVDPEEERRRRMFGYQPYGDGQIF
jgi:hypothetical protein